jgi:hypothetical protein
MPIRQNKFGPRQSSASSRAALALTLTRRALARQPAAAQFGNTQVGGPTRPRFQERS